MTHIGWLIIEPELVIIIIQTTLFIPTLDTTTKSVIMTIWLLWKLQLKGDNWVLREITWPVNDTKIWPTKIAYQLMVNVIT